LPYTTAGVIRAATVLTDTRLYMQALRCWTAHRTRRRSGTLIACGLRCEDQVVSSYAVDDGNRLLLVEHVLATHGGPSDRPALKRASPDVAASLAARSGGELAVQELRESTGPRRPL
jgi:hypothetical protein